MIIYSLAISFYFFKWMIQVDILFGIKDISWADFIMEK